MILLSAGDSLQQNGGYLTIMKRNTTTKNFKKEKNIRFFSFNNLGNRVEFVKLREWNL